MLRSSQMAGVIGEPIVTVRAGRYVIPIRAEAKGRLKGIVHDQSASGATLFIEPLTVVELNNTWTEATLAEEREEERILDALSRDGRGSVPTSLAREPRRTGARRPVDGPRPARRADGRGASGDRRRRGRAALGAPSPARRGGGADRPALGDRFGYRALVVTGPNTGGKTV